MLEVDNPSSTPLTDPPPSILSFLSLNIIVCEAKNFVFLEVIFSFRQFRKLKRCFI